jgi:hypothetical protein
LEYEGDQDVGSSGCDNVPDGNCDYDYDNEDVPNVPAEVDTQHITNHMLERLQLVRKFMSGAIRRVLHTTIHLTHRLQLSGFLSWKIRRSILDLKQTVLNTVTTKKDCSVMSLWILKYTNKIYVYYV